MGSASEQSGAGPGPVRRRLLGLAAPVYLELLSGVVAGIVDTLWVSRLGVAAVGAVAVATTLENVLLGVILLANIGTTVVLAERLGRDPSAHVLPVVRAAGVLWLVITPVVAVGGLLGRERIAALFTGGNGEVFRLTVEFLAVSFPGIAVFFAQNVVDGVFKGAGDTRTPMRTAMLANSLILLLDPLLIYGFAGLPPLGVQGAALGTVLGRAVAFTVSVLLLRRLLRGLRQAPRTPHVPSPSTTSRPGPLNGTRAALRRVLAVGLPASGDFILRMGIAVALVGVVARFGEAPLAAYGIGTKVILFATMAFYAVRQAASILLARTGSAVPGAGAVIGRQALLIASVLAVGAGTALLLGGGPLLRAFSSDPEVIGEGRVLLRFLALYLVALAGVVSLGGVFMGGGLAGAMFRITLSGAAVQIPLAYGLSALPVLGVRGVWLSMVLGTASQYALSFSLFRRHFPGAPEPARRTRARAR
ncbi:MATE family efflux transporter [Streptomyces sp. N2-109]|uniref:Probable multidrug resistance protein NorM n=1 Tax=Streptomyces gossypii TaxID=2883101 RepID=A0ABT2JMP1_9ACTN|nr:MATE family efflux transporter [Streptomyces gossypii]MCT2589001.1 MATE family efflux transporter [Streptomyces gossypii]